MLNKVISLVKVDFSDDNQMKKADTNNTILIMWKGLANLFEGHPNKYLTTSLTGEVDERGKREAKCTTVHEPLTGNVWIIISKVSYVLAYYLKKKI